MPVDFLDIVKAELMMHDIDLCDGEGCNMGRSHGRGFAVPDQRTIHYSRKCATRSTLHGFLHEVGHIIKCHGKSCKLKRFQREAEAEAYATTSLRQYGIPVPRRAVALGKAYVKRWKAFGVKVSHRHTFLFVRQEGNQVFSRCSCGMHRCVNKGAQ